MQQKASRSCQGRGSADLQQRNFYILNTFYSQDFGEARQRVQLIETACIIAAAAEGEAPAASRPTAPVRPATSDPSRPLLTWHDCATEGFTLLSEGRGAATQVLSQH